MDWLKDQGDNLATIIKQARSGVEEALAVLETQPKLTSYQSYIWSIYQELQTERPASMAGVNRIPISKIREYVTVYEMNNTEEIIFRKTVLALDIYECQRANKSLGKKLKTK